MMKGAAYGLLLGLGLCFIYSVPAFADEYVLDAVYMEDGDSSADLEGDPLEYEWFSFETPSNASADAGVSPLSSYSGVYDGSMSSTYVNYAKDTVSKLGPGVHYVFFRPSQYQYRLVYGADLEVDGSNFSGSGLSYVAYDTRYYTVSSGNEGSFSLAAGNYLVYTDLEGMYPSLDSGVRNYEFITLLLFCGFAVVFVVVRSFLGVGSFRI